MSEQEKIVSAEEFMAVLKSIKTHAAERKENIIKTANRIFGEENTKNLPVHILDEYLKAEGIYIGYDGGLFIIDELHGWEE